MRYTYKWLVCVSAHPRCWTRQFQAPMGTYSREDGTGRTFTVSVMCDESDNICLSHLIRLGLLTMTGTQTHVCIGDETTWISSSDSGTLMTSRTIVGLWCATGWRWALDSGRVAWWAYWQLGLSWRNTCSGTGERVQQHKLWGTSNQVVTIQRERLFEKTHTMLTYM